jgi:hypothetical protein
MEELMSNCSIKALIEHDAILNASYDLLLREAEREGLTVDNAGGIYETYLTILAGSNGAFALFCENIPVICNRLSEGFDLPAQIVLVDSKSGHISMTVESPTMD